MNDAFEKTLRNHTLPAEGGYVHDPADSGGETFQGISRRNNPKWPGWALIDIAKNKVGVKRLAPYWTTIDEYFKDNDEMFALVAEVYRTKYWPPVAKMLAPERATAKIFDAGVNVGPGQAIKFAQSIIGTAADGAIGPRTLAAAGEYFSGPGAEKRFLVAYCKVQEQFYRDIVRRKPSQKKFLNGWLRRAAWIPED